jgi:hypothetical protein
MIQGWRFGGVVSGMVTYSRGACEAVLDIIEPTPDANRANSSAAGSSIPIPNSTTRKLPFTKPSQILPLATKARLNSHTNSNNVSHRSQLRAFHEREEQHVENHISHYSRLQNRLPLLAHDENFHPPPEVRALTEPLPNEVKLQIASKMTPSEYKERFHNIRFTF